MTMVDGNTFVGVRAIPLWTLRSRSTEAKRVDGALDDPWAVKLFGFSGTLNYGYSKVGGS
jgi:hypothetical protein